MPQIKLTDAIVRRASCPAAKDQMFYSDSEQPGLQLRITRAGGKAFVVDRRSPAGRVRATLGTTDELTVYQARSKAAEALGAIARGANGETVQAALAKNDGILPDGALTFGDVFKEFIRERKLSERTKYDYKRLVGALDPRGPDPRGQGGPIKDWMNRPIQTITANDVKDKFLGIESEAVANYAMRLARAIFNYASGPDGLPLINPNPVAILGRKKLWHRQDPKRQIIERDQFPAWWKAVQELDGSAIKGRADVVKDLLVFLLMTGLRRGEATSLKWDDVSLERRAFTLATSKNRMPHALPLGDYLTAMLTRRHQSKNSVYVFPGELGVLIEPKRQLRKIIAVSGVEFTLHTLRRTFGTAAESLDISSFTVKRLLNHKAQDVTGKHYLNIDVERLRKPMQLIEDHFLTMAGAKPSAKVMKMRGRRG